MKCLDQIACHPESRRRRGTSQLQSSSHFSWDASSAVARSLAVGAARDDTLTLTAN